MRSILDRYAPAPAYDEFADAGGRPRAHYAALAATLDGISWADFRHRVTTVNTVLLQRGVTFTVYTDARGTERILPFDLIPRIIAAHDWDRITRGVAQRVRALNAFLLDVYGEGRILRDRVVPRELVFSSPHYEREAIGVRPPRDVYVHVSGIDLIRDADGAFLVLEDNARTPSGISYVLENRDVLKRAFPRLFDGYDPRPVDDYPLRLRDALLAAAPPQVTEPTIALLTPGIHNSAYFEHTLLARRMGVELVEGNDLFVRDNVVYAKTTRGPQRIDVLYRRVDDDFMDPLYFRADSTLGVAGIFNAYRAGNVTLANAIGTGVADDKAVYPYVPAMIRYYLGEEPVLQNVPTFDCSDDVQRAHVLARLPELVVKRTTASGGYGMLMGPASTTAERAAFADAIRARPREFIAQPVVTLSAHPTVVEDGLAPRHIDLRPFALLVGDHVDVPPAALTRVALREGSLVVNSSQGGGSKDTWVLAD
ncbi:MAG: circularly permuted type 2 ATP-grasp protein [Candidatus Eremiobacteraeota bacterium]|nr:circularly permuted type 2 ATP-grasp protein [Candidatus Eremiobacteraeota bacterium]